MAGRVRLIALDIDGTLMTSSGRFHPDNIAAIRLAQNKGIVVAIASGRSPGNIYLMLREYGLECPMIAVNGAQCTDENLKTFALHPMADRAVHAVTEYLFDHAVPFFMMGDGFICTSDENMRHHSELMYGDRLPGIGHRFLHGARALEDMASSGRILKLFVPANPRLEEIRQGLRSIEGVELTRSNKDNIEILPHGVDKSVGLRDMADHYAVSPECIMAVGDEENDLPMLMYAPFSVAMRNGADHVKACAAYVTGTNDEGGAGDAIRRIALEV